MTIVLAWILLALFDLAMNAAAGASAATVGAHLNHKPLTVQIIRRGALAGLIKSAITTFQQVVIMGRVKFSLAILLQWILSPFAISFLVTTEVCNMSMGKGTRVLHMQLSLILRRWRR